MATTQTGRYESALGRSQEQYNKMIAEMQSAKEVAAEPIAPELLEIAEMYRTGGTYGVGHRKIAEEQLQKGLSANQAALIRSGMSSGSLSTGLRNRYSKDITTAFQTIEEGRTDKLSTALSAVAAAKEARGIRVGNAHTTTAQLVGGFKEPTTSEFMNQEELYAAESAAEKERLGMELTSQEKQLVMQLNTQQKIAAKQVSASKYATNVGAASVASQIGAQTKENIKYKLTAAQQAKIAKYALFM